MDSFDFHEVKLEKILEGVGQGHLSDSEKILRRTGKIDRIANTLRDV
jgi:hypothetical protein